MMRQVFIVLVFGVGLCLSVRGNYQCPRLRPGEPGICAFTCGSNVNTDCVGKSICCPTGCGGTSCRCPVGVPVVNCFVDPCQVSSCPAFPQAQCRSNFCGGCNAFFFIYRNGRRIDVTRSCFNRRY